MGGLTRRCVRPRFSMTEKEKNAALDQNKGIWPPPPETTHLIPAEAEERATKSARSLTGTGWSDGFVGVLVGLALSVVIYIAIAVLADHVSPPPHQQLIMCMIWLLAASANTFLCWIVGRRFLFLAWAMIAGATIVFLPMLILALMFT